MNTLSPTTPLGQALDSYLAAVRDSRSEHTYRTYRRATRAFMRALEAARIADSSTSVDKASSEWFRIFVTHLQRREGADYMYSPTTESVYLTALLGFVKDCLGPILMPSAIAEIAAVVRRRRRKVPLRHPPFPKSQIEEILAATQRAAQGPFEREEDRLPVLRDRAMLVTLADTGLRVFELCSLRRGQLDSPEGKVMVIGKGNKEAQVRLSRRAVRAIQVYLSARARTDGTQKRELASLPLFARHDKAARNRTLAMTTRSAERMLDRWVAATLGPTAVGTVTPHSFRHYFVTVAIRGSGGDFQVAKELARHANIGTTQRYAHISDEALDRAYSDIFNDARSAPDASG
jgi:integrase/recombinase XerC